MAIDTLARGLAASNSGGGGGSLDVGIENGVGIAITGTDPKKISNDGVTNITDSNEDGKIKVVFGYREGEDATKDVAVAGLKNSAFTEKTTTIADTTDAVDTKLPTEKAVRTELNKKVNSSVVGKANGVATLDANSKLTSSQLPSHNQASNTINAMTGYTKPGTTSAIDASTDTLNSAIGKLEKALDGKQATGTYATGDSSGNAVTANKLANTSAIGSVTKGVYFKADGTPATMTYEVNATVPSDAKFTDTTYTADLNTGVTVNNTTFKISNTGVRGFIDSKDSDGNGTFRANVGGTEKVIGIKGLSDAAYKGVQTTMTSASTDLPTSKAIAAYVADRISEIPDHNGTVTSVGVSVPTGLKVTNSPVTTSGTIAVTLDTGYEIPTSASLVKKVNNITPTNNNVTLAGDNIATKSSTYSKATAEADITKDTKVDSAIGQLDYRTGKNKSDISTIKGYINNGGSEAKNGTTCTINVPENVSDFASIAMVGGKTVKVTPESGDPYLVSAPVEKIVSKNSSGVVKTELSLTEITKNLPDYGCSAGNVYNYIDFETGKYYHNVKPLVLSELSWVYRAGDKLLYTNQEYNIKKVDKSALLNGITPIYDFVIRNEQTDKTIAGSGISGVTNGNLCVLDNRFTTDVYSTATDVVNAFKEYLSDTIVYVEMANPEVIDLNSFLSPIECESGGTITFVNEHSLDVPNKVIYKKEV